jgi:hypothetical protein
VLNNVDVQFQSILDFPSFSLRIAEDAVDSIPEVLKALSHRRVVMMQKALGAVWHRYRILSPVLVTKEQGGEEQVRSRVVRGCENLGGEQQGGAGWGGETW